MGAEAKILIAALLAAFGIAVPWSAFAGGLFLAFAASYLVMAFTEPEDRKSYALTLVTTLICALLAAIVHGAIFPGWSLQLMMACGGALSIYLVESVKSFGKKMIQAAGTVPDKLIDRVLGRGNAGSGKDEIQEGRDSPEKPDV